MLSRPLSSLVKQGLRTTLPAENMQAILGSCQELRIIHARRVVGEALIEARVKHPGQSLVLIVG